MRRDFHAVGLDRDIKATEGFCLRGDQAATCGRRSVTTASTS